MRSRSSKYYNHTFVTDEVEYIYTADTQTMLLSTVGFYAASSAEYSRGSSSLLIGGSRNANRRLV